MNFLDRNNKLMMGQHVTEAIYLAAVEACLNELEMYFGMVTLTDNEKEMMKEHGGGVFFSRPKTQPLRMWIWQDRVHLLSQTMTQLLSDPLLHTKEAIRKNLINVYVLHHALKRYTEGTDERPQDSFTDSLATNIIHLMFVDEEEFYRAMIYYIDGGRTVIYAGILRLENRLKFRSEIVTFLKEVEIEKRYVRIAVQLGELECVPKESLLDTMDTTKLYVAGKGYTTMRLPRPKIFEEPYQPIDVTKLINELSRDAYGLNISQVGTFYDVSSQRTFYESLYPSDLLYRNLVDRSRSNDDGEVYQPGVYLYNNRPLKPKPTLSGINTGMGQVETRQPNNSNDELHMAQNNQNSWPR